MAGYLELDGGGRGATGVLYPRRVLVDDKHRSGRVRGAVIEYDDHELWFDHDEYERRLDAEYGCESGEPAATTLSARDFMYADTSMRLSAEEARRLDLRGVPVRLEHRPGTEVGVVTESLFHPDDGLRVNMHLHEDEWGKHTLALVRAGRLRQLSIGMGCTFYGSGCVHKRFVQEISLVSKGYYRNADLCIRASDSPPGSLPPVTMRFARFKPAPDRKRRRRRRGAPSGSRVRKKVGTGLSRTAAWRHGRARAHVRTQQARRPSHCALRTMSAAAAAAASSSSGPDPPADAPAAAAAQPESGGQPEPMQEVKAAAGDDAAPVLRGAEGERIQEQIKALMQMAASGKQAEAESALARVYGQMNAYRKKVESLQDEFSRSLESNNVFKTEAALERRKRIDGLSEDTRAIVAACMMPSEKDQDKRKAATDEWLGALPEHPGAGPVISLVAALDSRHRDLSAQLAEARERCEQLANAERVLAGVAEGEREVASAAASAPRKRARVAASAGAAAADKAAHSAPVEASASTGHRPTDTLLSMFAGFQQSPISASDAEAALVMQKRRERERAAADMRASLAAGDRKEGAADGDAGKGEAEGPTAAQAERARNEAKVRAALRARDAAAAPVPKASATQQPIAASASAPEPRGLAGAHPDTFAALAGLMRARR